jgi:3-oxoacyl-[acyl-carrier-protein] synthase II
MMVGEGAGMLVLESLDHARKRGANVLATVSGYGHSCDAHHLTAPHPEGKGANAAMREALAQAGLDAADVGYINAHGTATQDNDRTEARAIHQVFGADVPVSSTKRFFGHTLAAAGGVEAVVSAWALMNQVLPANLGLREPLEDGPINLVGTTTSAQGLKHVLSNSFGFGGNNAALVFSKAEE